MKNYTVHQPDMAIAQSIFSENIILTISPISFLSSKSGILVK